MKSLERNKEKLETSDQQVIIDRKTMEEKGSGFRWGTATTLRLRS